MAFLAAKEAENLKLILPQVVQLQKDLSERSEIMVVDTASPMDDTEEVCKEFGARYVNQKWPRYGGALKTAFAMAGMDKIVILDADGSVDIEALPKLLQAKNAGNDLVIGSRYIEGGSHKTSRSSRLMSNICNACFRIALGVKIRDCSTSYRIYNVEDVRGLPLSSQNFDIMEEVLCKLRLKKGDSFRVEEVAVHDTERVEGRSRRSLLKFIYSLGRTLVRMVILRILARNGYEPEKHERQSETITKAVIACGVAVLALLIAAVGVLVFV